MPRYIDAEELKRLRQDVVSGKVDMANEGDLIDACPTADVAPRGEAVRMVFAEIAKLYEEFDDYDEISIGSLREDLVKLEKKCAEGVYREPKTVGTLDDLRAYLGSKGWSVYENKFDWTIGCFPPSGVQCTVHIRHDNDVKIAIDEIKSFAEFFNVDEHLEACAVMYPRGVRRQGVRKALSKQELVADAHAIVEMLNELVDGLSLCEQKSVDETLAEAVGRVSAAEVSGKGQGVIEPELN